jgi:hypothetical protein
MSKKEQGYWFILQGTKGFREKLEDCGINTSPYCMIKVDKKDRTPLANALRKQAKKQLKELGWIK